MNKCLLFVGIVLLFSCGYSRKENTHTLLKDWIGREIIFPKRMIFTLQATDTICVNLNEFEYKIVNYVDTTGCTTCRLQLPMWNDFWKELTSAIPNKTALYFFLYPKDFGELKYALKYDNFQHPVCVDLNDSLNSINRFPTNWAFHTFLLDKDNRVLAVGNPIHNPKVRELYLKIIRGENVSQEEETPRTQTTVEANRTEADMGRFDWREKQTAEFVLKNTGDSPLVILDTHTSCGCTQAEYDGKPVLPGDSLVLRVTYKADNPGHFRKSVLVRSNAEQELLKLIVTGEAEERK